DNSGTRATGRLQGNLSIGIDNPLGLNDIFNIGVSQDLEFGDKRLGSHGWNGFYSIPWGYWTATIAAYTNTYYQQIAGVNQTFIEDTEITQQRRNNTLVELGLTDRHYVGGAQFDGALAYRQGIGGFGARDDILFEGGRPYYRYGFAVLDVN
ncbi:ShlB/FhaC/HecB family hemolysin secretion/activation protein, partial [Burkholderia cepacia]|uniref:ShlB/FhaC/HecB family hemolysin secretion/activation protein n=1 Tax=Burkholderia cepacia TaxID=292 RepID=UPI001FC8879B